MADEVVGPGAKELRGKECGGGADGCTKCDGFEHRGVYQMHDAETGEPGPTYPQFWCGKFERLMVRVG